MTLQWLIWSNEHAGFWKASRHGYTRSMADAGRFSDEEARAIVDRATLGGRLTFKAEDGRELPPDMLLLAPAVRVAPSPEVLAAGAVVEFTSGQSFPGNDRLKRVIADVIRFDRDVRS